MALQLNRRKFKLSTATTGALIVGVGLVIFKTFPHLSSIFTSYSKSDEILENDDNTPIEIRDGTSDLVQNAEPLALSENGLVDSTDWLEAKLKSFLIEVRTLPPGWSKFTNQHSKISTLPPTLIMIVLCLLLNQFKKGYKLSVNILLILRFLVVLFLLRMQRVFS